MPNHIQIILFWQDPPKANKVAEACFPEVEIVAFNSQDVQSFAQLASEYQFGVASSVALARVDFVWEPISQPPNLNYAEIDLDLLIPQFEKIEKFAAESNVNRVACVLSNNQPYSSIRDSIVGLGDYAPKLEIIEGATEIFFRTNVPKHISGYDINRLMSIQTASAAFIKVGVAGQSEQKFEKIMQVTMDVNSDQMKPLPLGKAGEALAIVRDEAIRLITDGITGL